MFTNSPRLIAGYYVLLRLLLPRHPPCALKNLITEIKDARVHCAVLKLRAGPSSTSAFVAKATRFVRIRWSGQPVFRPGPRWGLRPIPQDPTVCLVVMFFRGIVPARGRTESRRCLRRYHVDVPSMSSRRSTHESDTRPWTLRGAPSAP